MIRMSRFRAPARASLRALRAAGTILRPWHAACLLAGCFYVLPIPPIDVNEPPVVVEPDEDPKIVVATGAQVVLTVIAYDPEGAAVDFEWPDLDNVPHDLDLYWRGELRVARVTIHDRAALPGPRVRAFVFDGDRDNVVTVRFEVVSP